MRISTFLYMAKDILIVAAILVAILVGLFTIGYRLIYKKILKGDRKLNIITVVLNAIFLCYLLVVLFATLLTRTSAEVSQRTILGLLDSYRYAWSTMNSYEWRYIILNICMFVPFGFLFPIVYKKFSQWRYTYLAGAVATLFIEVLQLVLKRGIFEADDIMNNIIGTMIGYGFYRIYTWIVSLIRKDLKNTCKKREILLCQVPLLLTIILLVGIFQYYNTKELGNLACTYTTKFDMKEVEFVNNNPYLFETSDNATVYQIEIASQEEAKQFASDLFEKVGTTIDEERTDIYDETMVFYSKEQDYDLWLNYKGFTWSFTNVGAMLDEDTEFENETLISLERSYVEAELSKMGISLPDTCIFENLGDGQYHFTVNEELVDDMLYDGTLSCRFNSDGILENVNNEIFICKEYKNYELISEQEAMKTIENGDIYTWYYDLHDIESIIINEVKLEYVTDSKGYYQPVYMFYTTINQNNLVTLMVPAIKN